GSRPPFQLRTGKAKPRLRLSFFPVPMPWQHPGKGKGEACASPFRWHLLRPSAAAEAAAAPVTGFLPLAEEGLVIHRLLVRMLLQHVPDIVVVVRDAAAQPRGLDQPPPHPLVRGVVGDGDELGTHGLLLTGGPARPAAPR